MKDGVHTGLGHGELCDGLYTAFLERCARDGAWDERHEGAASNGLEHQQCVVDLTDPSWYEAALFQERLHLPVEDGSGPILQQREVLPIPLRLEIGRSYRDQ